jgi:hypothetical protein
MIDYTSFNKKMIKASALTEQLAINAPEALQETKIRRQDLQR